MRFLLGVLGGAFTMLALAVGSSRRRRISKRPAVLPVNRVNRLPEVGMSRRLSAYYRINLN